MSSPDRPQQARRASFWGIAFLVAAVAVAIGLAVWIANDPNACRPTADEACSTFAWTALAVVPFTILLIGAIGAGIETFRAYRNGAEYQQWHIVTWLLLVCMATYAAFAAMSLVGA